MSKADGSIFMPPQATEIAKNVDNLYEFLLIVSFISCVLVIGGLIYFAIVHRRKEGDRTPYIAHNTTLEFLWSFIPFVIFMVVFVWGWVVYHQLRSMPEGALEIGVHGQKWDWSFTYKNGRKVAAEFTVPINQDVKLLMTSADVLHSFYIPAFRTKQDVVPGRYAALWFNANKLGTFHVFCAEYCGDKHSSMLAKVKVVSREDYEAWLVKDPYKGLPPFDIGKDVYTKRCASCHSLADVKIVGPGWKGIFGRQEKLTDGSTVTVDENYIRESIVDPNIKVVEGYAPQMPTFAGQLSEEGIIEYMKTLK